MSWWSLGRCCSLESLGLGCWGAKLWCSHGSQGQGGAAEGEAKAPGMAEHLPAGWCGAASPCSPELSTRSQCGTGGTQQG